ncbi:MAG: hypothetical protein EPO07_06010, partial [Verrucomicrobia bacterium]
QKWLALHQQFSPSRNDADCAATYDRAFTEAVSRIETDRVHVIGLGCGGGQKDTRLLKLLSDRRAEISYTPCDVSTAMVLTARQAALAVLPEQKCFPLVCDLTTTDDLPELLVTRHPSPVTRLITFFGMIPNFEPDDILPKLSSLIREQDWLLFSANLAPGDDYAAGAKRILPQYDNVPTRDWLLSFLFDLGIEREDGELRFSVEETSGLNRIAARFHFTQARRIEIESEAFAFQPGESIQLFFSYRYTPERVRDALLAHRLEVRRQWITASGEEGVFLCTR